MNDLLLNETGEYSAPRVEVAEIKVEAGFAQSNKMNGLPDYGEIF